MGKSRSRYNERVGRNLLLMREQGYTIAGMAERYEVSSPTISAWLRKTKEAGLTAATKPKKRRKYQRKPGAKAERINAVLQENPTMSYGECLEAIKPLTVHKSYFQKVCTRFAKEARKTGQLRQAVPAFDISRFGPAPAAQPKRNSKSMKGATEVQQSQLEKEIAYLQWWKEGELNSWVKRLLDEWQKVHDDS